MNDSRTPDIRRLETVAYDRGGYFTAADARDHGVSSQLVDHHIRHDRFERVRRGLFRIRGFPTTEHDEMREKWMAVGTDKALLCHESALALLELGDIIPDAVHLLVPRRHRGLRRPPGSVIHTRPDDEEVSMVWRDGLPLTPPARTLVDILGKLQPEQEVMAVTQALQRGLTTERQLHDEAMRRRKQGAVEAVLKVERAG